MTRSSKSSASGKTPRGKRGPKPGSGKSRKPPSRKPAKPRKAKPGAGTKNLLNSVNTRVSLESDRIAAALIDKTVAGNIESARLLLELTNTPLPEKDDEDSLGNFSLAKFLAEQPEFVRPPLGSVWTGYKWEDPEKAPQAILRQKADDALAARLNPGIAANPGDNLHDDDDDDDDLGDDPDPRHDCHHNPRHR
jgi:hypothetical protein